MPKPGRSFWHFPKGNFVHLVAFKGMSLEPRDILSVAHVFETIFHVPLLRD